MPRAASYSGSFEEMPLSVQRAAAVSRDFYADALCIPSRTTHPSLAWIADPNKTYRLGSENVSGEVLIQWALTTCQICPVQWECASAALAAEEAAGIWADTLDNLRALRGRPEVLVQAKRRGVSVQVAVRRLTGAIS
jgi:hypothetical protein